MNGIFSVQDRRDAFEYVVSAAEKCDRIIALVQVGSGAIGYHDERSDLDFVIALDSAESMKEVTRISDDEVTHCFTFNDGFSAVAAPIVFFLNDSMSQNANHAQEQAFDRTGSAPI